MRRRETPNLVAAALAALWLILFLFTPLFVMEIQILPVRVNGCQAISAAPAVLLMAALGALMLVSALFLEKQIGMILSAVSFVATLVFLLTCGSSICAKALLALPLSLSGVSYSMSGLSSASSYIHVIWGFGGVCCLILCAAVFAAELLLGDRYARSSQVQVNTDFDF